MNRILIRNIFAILLYAGFFSVQLRAGFLIQENIKFRNDYNCLKKVDHTHHHTDVLSSNKNFSKHKKSNMNRRFIPEEIKHLPNCDHSTIFSFNASPTKATLKNRLLSISQYQLDDRGPPATA